MHCIHRQREIHIQELYHRYFSEGRVKVCTVETLHEVGHTIVVVHPVGNF